MYSKEELKKQASDKRELKTIRKRRPEKKIAYSNLIHIVAQKSGFQKANTKEVLDTMISVILEKLQLGYEIKLQNICTMYPAVKRARQGTALNGNNGKPTQMIVPPMWELKFHSNDYIVEKLKNKQVTLQDIEFIYK